MEDKKHDGRKASEAPSRSVLMLPCIGSRDSSGLYFLKVSASVSNQEFSPSLMTKTEVCWGLCFSLNKGEINKIINKRLFFLFTLLTKLFQEILQKEMVSFRVYISIPE